MTNIVLPKKNNFYKKLLSIIIGSLAAVLMLSLFPH
jgi:hypothetical protein